VRGTYCIVAWLRGNEKISVGALGEFAFPAGTYVYVGSAARGIEQRVKRHKSSQKRLRWHIDYFLARADVVSTIAIPSDDRRMECAVVAALSKCQKEEVVPRKFGSSDCRCPSHLLYFGDTDPEDAMETIVFHLTTMPGVYASSESRDDHG
jgi:Uri superfamily endonuclease